MEQQNDEYILNIVKEDVHLLEFADNSLKKNKNIMMKVVEMDGNALEYIDDSLKKDKDIVLKAIGTNNGHVLRYADDSLRQDKSIVIAAVKTNGSALAYADDILKQDRDVVLEAIKNDGLAIQYINNELKRDKELVIQAMQQNGQALEHIDSSHKYDKDIACAAVKQTAYALEHVDDNIKNTVLESIDKTDDIGFLYDGKTYTGTVFNTLLPNAKFRKRLNDKMTTKGFKYHIGLNIDTNKFQTEKECSAGGLYFTIEKYINHFDEAKYGSNVYEIKIPDDAIVYVEGNYKAKASHLVIVKRV
jgi:hypothetical protein